MNLLPSEANCAVRRETLLSAVLCVAVASEAADANLLPAGDLSPKLVPADVSAVDLASSAEVPLTCQTPSVQRRDVTAQ